MDTGQMRWLKFLASLTLLFSASLALAAPSGRPFPLRHGAIHYFNAGHTQQLNFEEDELLWLSELPLSVQPGTRDAIFKEKLRDCSTKTLICFGGRWTTFAVPRAGMAIGTTYSIGPTRYQVVNCDNPDACVAFQVTMSCPHFDADTDQCTDGAGRPAASLESGPFMSFTYNRFLGVTAINLHPKAPLYEFFLQGDKGLLMPSMAPTR